MDWREGTVDPGASVEAADGPLGTVEEVILSPTTGELSHLVARRGATTERVTIPASAIADIPSRHTVRLKVGREELARMASGTMVSGAARGGAADVRTEWRGEARDSGQIRVPILEERLRVGTRPVELGEVVLHKTVETFEAVERQPILREDVVIERVPVNRTLDAPEQPRMEGDWLVVPIMEEVLVVQKKLMVKEEVRILKRQVTEEYEVREQLRRERVELEDGSAHGFAGRGGAASHPIAPAARTGAAPAQADGSPIGSAGTPLASADAPRVAGAAGR